MAQKNLKAEIEQLSKTMYTEFAHDNYEALLPTVAKLKEACLQAGDYKMFYKAWTNEIIKTKVHEGRPEALKKIREMHDYALEHDHKYGLYAATYSTAYILHQINDMAGAMENYLNAADYLKHYFPEESVAPIYVSLSSITLAQKKDSAAIRYAQMALDDPNVTNMHRYLAKACICIAWGWLGNREKFDENYEKLKAVKGVNTDANREQTIEIFRAHLHGEDQEAIRLAHQFKNKQNRLLYIYKTNEWAGDFKNTFYAYKDYNHFMDSVNNRDLREQAKFYQTELNVVRSENESKDLRLTNKRLLLEHMENELEN